MPLLRFNFLSLNAEKFERGGPYMDIRVAKRIGRVNAPVVRGILKLMARPDILFFAGGIPAAGHSLGRL